MDIPPGIVHAPEFELDWLNHPPFSLRQLRGRVVLVDFWDYTCVNCLRTLPYLIEWHRRYAVLGLTILGVHAPEFSFARDRKLVREAVERFGIPYPVALDNDFTVWQAYGNFCWPAKYLIDSDGFLRFVHYGEGAYVQIERAIQALLRERNPAVVLPPLPAALETHPAGVSRAVTPELYLGLRRGGPANLPNSFRDRDPLIDLTFTLPSQLDPDNVYLYGCWRLAAESICSTGPAGMVLVCTAQEVNLVMQAQPPQRIELRQDDHPVAPLDGGADVRCEATGSFVDVHRPRMYRLLQSRRYGQHRLELSAPQAGWECYAFTFGALLADAAEP